MLISRSLIFVHHPKTGGSSVQDYLLRHLPDTYYPFEDKTMTREQKAWIMHQGLRVAHQYAARLGFDPARLPILVCLRNPYALVLSGYQYLAQRWRDDIPDLEADFSEYVVNLYAKASPEKRRVMAEAPYGPFSTYLLAGGRKPENLTVARTETLNRDVKAFLKDQLGVEIKADLPRRNVGEHAHFASFYTRKEEEIVYAMYRNVFDKGIYARFDGLNRDSL